MKPRNDWRKVWISSEFFKKKSAKWLIPRLNWTTFKLPSYTILVKPKHSGWNWLVSSNPNFTWRIRCSSRIFSVSQAIRSLWNLKTPAQYFRTTKSDLKNTMSISDRAYVPFLILMKVKKSVRTEVPTLRITPEWNENQSLIRIPHFQSPRLLLQKL